VNAQLKPSITIQAEHYSDAFWAELLPMIRTNWEASPSYMPEFPIDPDLARYRQLDSLGRLLCLSARENGRLIGYSVMILNFAMHHRTVICGFGDVIYVEEGRGRAHVAADLIRASREWARSKGARRLAWWVEPDSPLKKILQSLGFASDEVLMEQVL
jgi:GNAT superfamily N-acetyltransferase